MKIKEMKMKQVIEKFNFFLLIITGLTIATITACSGKDEPKTDNPLYGVYVAGNGSHSRGHYLQLILAME